MRLLLDTHIVLAEFGQGDAVPPADIRRRLDDPASDLYVSVATLWEIAIKYRLGKLDLSVDLQSFPELLRVSRLHLVEISARHALADVFPEPPTRDPFDRLLLAQCQTEGFRLVTLDRALAGHPLAASAH